MKNANARLKLKNDDKIYNNKFILLIQNGPIDKRSTEWSDRLSTKKKMKKVWNQNQTNRWAQEYKGL